jgi:hypothetical protein
MITLVQAKLHPNDLEALDIIADKNKSTRAAAIRYLISIHSETEFELSGNDFLISIWAKSIPEAISLAKKELKDINGTYYLISEELKYHNLRIAFKVSSHNKVKVNIENT